MAALKKTKQQEIPFILDGKTIIKSVNKNTTCSDVINKLPKLQSPLAVFESVDGVEKELTGKTKLLKVCRANGSAKKVEFIIRKSQMLTNVKKSTRKLSPGGKKCKNQGVKSSVGQKLSKETLKQVSDLAFYVRYQKTKLQALNTKSDSGASEQKRLMKRMTSNASVNSMDAFLAKADLNEMARFLTFCGEVTAEKLGCSKPKRNSVENTEETVPCVEQQQTIRAESAAKMKKRVIHESLKSMKLGLKQKFVPKSKVQRSTSTGTISSTDTGYQSIGSEVESENSVEDKYSTNSAISLNVPNRQTFVFSDLNDEPRHSTPVFAGRTQKRRADHLDSTFTGDHTLTAENLGDMDEFQGKTMILQKFMADQNMAVSSRISGNDVYEYQDVKKRRIERYSMPAAFRSQEDICRFYWNQSCDSDSDSESECSQPCESLDLAFNAGAIDAIETLETQKKTLRRESAISNLNRFSLLSRDIGLNTFGESNGFDYSFDCSFPRMEESQTEDFTFDFSCDFDDSDSESENETGSNEDDSMDSFMNTRSFHNLSGDNTLC